MRSFSEKTPVLPLWMLMAFILLPPLIIWNVHRLAMPGYWISSSYKLIFLLPLAVRRWGRGWPWRRVVLEGFDGARFRRYWLRTLAVAAGLSGLYFSAFLIFRARIDVTAVRSHLAGTAGTSPGTILWIGLFIIVVNSVVEEFFWRGFLLREFQNHLPLWAVHLVTGIGFSFHHAVFYIHWFNFPLIALSTLGLFGFAVIMNDVFLRIRDLYSCWVVHAAVDVVQIIIGIQIIGISV